MDIKELAKILGSSGGSSQYKYIPWWEGDFDEDRYRYSMFKEQEIQDAETCIAMCSGEELSDTSGNGECPFSICWSGIISWERCGRSWRTEAWTSIWWMAGEKG